jgi:hypothetical protein
MYCCNIISNLIFERRLKNGRIKGVFGKLARWLK